jgi:streptogramin lyase
MTTDGTITNTFMAATEAWPYNMAVGNDGNIWITEFGSEAFYGDPFTPPQIVRMSTDGQMTAFPMPSATSAPATIRATANGLVFTDIGTNAVGLIDYSGNVVEWPSPPTPTDGVQSAAQGSDGSYYFGDEDTNRIGKITLGEKGMIFPQFISIAGAGNTQLVGVAVLGDRGPYKATTDNANVATVAPISGFAMNFMVTAVAPGTTTLEIKGKGKAMSATITVTAGTSTQSVRRRVVRLVEGS